MQETKGMLYTEFYLATGEGVFSASTVFFCPAEGFFVGVFMVLPARTGVTDDI